MLPGASRRDRWLALSVAYHGNADRLAELCRDALIEK